MSVTGDGDVTAVYTAAVLLGSTYPGHCQLALTMHIQVASSTVYVQVNHTCYLHTLLEDVTDLSYWNDRMGKLPESPTVYPYKLILVRCTCYLNSRAMSLHKTLPPAMEEPRYCPQYLISLQGRLIQVTACSSCCLVVWLRSDTSLPQKEALKPSILRYQAIGNMSDATQM